MYGIKNSYRYLGISYDTFMKWLKYQLPEGYTMNDFLIPGKLEMDHVLPLNHFDFNDEQERYDALSWLNVRPIESYKNRHKGAKIDYCLYVEQVHKAKRFMSDVL